MSESTSSKSKAVPQPVAADVTSQADAAAGTGRTVIADHVIAKVAGIAARDVPGVHALGGGAARALGAIRQAIGNQDLSQGVGVEVGERQVAADVSIVVEYPQPMKAVADEVRAAVRSAIEDLVGMEAAEINVTINDVFIPGDDDADDEATADPAAPRVS